MITATTDSDTESEREGNGESDNEGETTTAFKKDFVMGGESMDDNQYRQWLTELKQKVRSTQLKAAVSVNRELLRFYWELGAGIFDKQQNAQWGDGFLPRLSRDLIATFPDMKGFSLRNVKYVRQWYLFYKQVVMIRQQAVAQLPGTEPINSKVFSDSEQAVPEREVVALITAIPWGHNLVIISKCSGTEEALFYVNRVMQNNWSRSVLTHQIESGLWQRKGRAITNFESTLPQPQSDLATQILKDPYAFDFLTLIGRDEGTLPAARRPSLGPHLGPLPKGEDGNGRDTKRGLTRTCL